MKKSIKSLDDYLDNLDLEKQEDIDKAIEYAKFMKSVSEKVRSFDESKDDSKKLIEELKKLYEDFGFAPEEEL